GENADLSQPRISTSGTGALNVRLATAQPTEWQRIGNQIDTAFIFAWMAKNIDCLLVGAARSSLAPSLPAAINRPLTFFPLGETAKGSFANNHQSKTRIKS